MSYYRHLQQRRLKRRLFNAVRDLSLAALAAVPMAVIVANVILNDMGR